jgi:hypothetical protein
MTVTSKNADEQELWDLAAIPRYNLVFEEWPGRDLAESFVIDRDLHDSSDVTEFDLLRSWKIITKLWYSLAWAFVEIHPVVICANNDIDNARNTVGPVVSQVENLKRCKCFL